MHKLILPMTIFLCLNAACRTTRADQELLSLEMESCPAQEGFGLLGDETRRKVSRKIDDFKALAGQCEEVATKNFARGMRQKSFVCSCLRISMEAYLYAEDQKEKSNLVNDAVECFRHCHWQAHMTCLWSENIAQDLGDVREKNTDATQDSARDQYHNHLGRKFMSTHQSNPRLEGKSCKAKSGISTQFIFDEGLCAKFDKQQNGFAFANEVQIQSSYEKFAE